MKKIIIVFGLILLVACATNQKKMNPDNYHINKTSKITQQNPMYDFSNLGNGWFRITEAVIIHQNLTPEEAKEKAIQKACKQAIEYYSGIEVGSRAVDIKAEAQDEILLDNFSSLTELTTRGIVLEKKILEEKTVIAGNQIKKVVTIKVKVGKQEGEKDPGFEIRANLNRDHFKQGEELKLTVKSTKDCYITVLNICSNDSVYVIFPNRYQNNNFLQAGEVFTLPDKSDKEIGLSYKITLMPNKEEDIEMIKVIATKEKIDFSFQYSFSAYGTYKSTLIDLQKWLLKIPREEIEEVDLQYFVSK